MDLRFLGFVEKISEDNYKIKMVHNMPFDEVHGLGKTKEELETEGFLVEYIPPELPVLEGYDNVLHYNPIVGSAYYEYEQIITEPIQE